MEFARLENLIPNENFNLIQEELICGICKNIKLDPVMCDQCQNTYCSKCIDKWSEKMKGICPSLCKEPNYTKCRFLNFLYSELTFKCRNGCDVKIPFDDLKNHYKTDCPVLKEQSYRKISDENIELKAQIAKLLSENRELKNISRGLKSEVEKLTRQNKAYKLKASRVSEDNNESKVKEKITNDHGLISDIIFFQNDLDLIISWIKLIHFSKGRDCNEVKLNLLYKATRDTDKVSIFRQKCQNISKTLVLIRAKNGAVFGGYTEALWKNEEGFCEDENSFIFNIKNGNMYKCKDSKYSIFNGMDMGPCFGNWDLVVVDNFFSKESYDYTPIAYVTDRECELAETGSHFLVEELEVCKVEVS